MSKNRRKRNRAGNNDKRRNIYNILKNDTSIESKIEIDGIEVDILEEMIVALSMDGWEVMDKLLDYVVSNMTEDELIKVVDNIDKLIREDLLLWSGSYASCGIEKIAILAIATSDTEIARECFIMLVDALLYRLWNLRDKKFVRIKHYDDIDLDKFCFSISMEWAIRNKLLTNLEFELDDIEDIDKYISYKKGETSKKEFIEWIVTGDYKLPLPLCEDEIYANPNYSWSGFDENNNLENSGLNGESIKFIQSVIQRFYRCVKDISEVEAKLHIYGRYFEKHRDKYKDMENKLTRVCDNKAKLSKKYSGIRSDHKKLRKELEKISGDLRRSNSKLNVLEKECESLRKSNVTIDELNCTIEKYESGIEKLDELLVDKNRTISKLNKEIDDIKEYTNQLEIEHEVVVDEFKQFKENNTSVNLSIPIENIVKSIQDKRIVIIGGDYTHNKIKELGFSNLRLIETDRRTVSASEISNADVLVFFVSYLSHSFMEFPKQYAIQNDIPIIYFRGKNLELLCNELFMEFYKI